MKNCPTSAAERHSISCPSICRAAAASGVAFLFAGGVNAAAAIAILPLPAWWLLTRAKGKRKNQLIRWWVLAIGLASLWWIVPLLVLGRYSPPFLDWVESAAVSTSKATLPGSFRGTTQWVAWFRLPEPIWLAGWSVLSSPAGILLGWLLICLGLLGLLRRDTPHRAFLVGGVDGASGRVVGLAEAHPTEATGAYEIAVSVHPDHRGRGWQNQLLAARLEALERAGVPWAASGTHAENHASRRNLLRAGFALVGMRTFTAHPVCGWLRPVTRCSRRASPAR